MHPAEEMPLPQFFMVFLLHADQFVSGIVQLKDLLHAFGILGKVFHEQHLLMAHHSGIIVDRDPGFLQVPLAGVPPAHPLWLFLAFLEFLGDVINDRKKMSLGVRLQSFGVRPSPAPDFFHGVPVKQGIHDDVVMCLPLGIDFCHDNVFCIGKTHLLSTIVHPSDEPGKTCLCPLDILRHVLKRIGQADQKIVPSEICLHQCLKISSGISVVQLSPCRCAFLKLPLPSKALCRGVREIGYLDKMRPLSIPSTMTNIFSDSSAHRNTIEHSF